MRRKPIAIVGIVSPMLLISACVLAVLFIGVVGWLFSRAEDDQIVKIATVGPLFRLKIFDIDSTKLENDLNDAANEELVTTDKTVNIQAQPQAVAPETSNPIDPSASSLSGTDIEEQLGFALPPGAVNSITQEGVASRLVIPKLSLDAPIILAPIENQTWKVDHLGQSIGHLEGTAQPGSHSNLVLAAHVTLESGDYGPFAGLGLLSSGDAVYVYDGEEQFEYIVDSHNTVERTAVEVTYPTDTGQITLITCNNWDSQERRYVERLVLKGHLIDN